VVVLDSAVVPGASVKGALATPSIGRLHPATISKTSGTTSSPADNFRFIRANSDLDPDP